MGSEMCIRDSSIISHNIFSDFLVLPFSLRRKSLDKTLLTLPSRICLLYTSDAADEKDSVDLGGRRIIKKTFFQAEDGIRDRSPSRGLGDVYKRQLLISARAISKEDTSRIFPSILSFLSLVETDRVSRITVFTFLRKQRRKTKRTCIKPRIKV